MTAVDAPVVSRIELPFAEDQAPFEEQVAVVGDAIWLSMEGVDTHLVRVDLATDEVAAVVEVDPSVLIAGDGRLWTMSPVGMVPGPPRLTLSLVDLETNAVIPTRYPEVWAAGMGFLWGISYEAGLSQVEPETGFVTATYPTLKGQEYQLQVACERVWFRGEDESLTAFDPVSSELGEPIDVAETGVGRVHETSDGCWAVLGTPGEYPVYTFGNIARIDSTGVVMQSPAVWDRIHIVGDTFWASSNTGLIWRIDPATGLQIGHRWQLPSDDLPTDPKFANWRLMAANGQTYLLTAKSLTHLDLPTD